MQGVSNQWSVWTTTPKITLTNLPAGDYSLQIKAKNEQSNETTPQTIRLHIEQIFYKTWWFYVFCVMGLMMLLLVWRHNEIQKSNKKQAQALYLAQLKTKVLEAQVKGIESQFTTHFVLNVLSVLLAKIGMNKQAEAEKFIHQISNFYKSVLTNNKTVYRTVAQEIQNAQKYLDLTCGMHRDKPIKCDFLNENNTHNPDINNLLVPAGFMQIYIENAFKHGLQFKNDGEREIHIEIITHADDHLFIIENNGKNLQDHTNKPDSTGKGIAFIQEIAAMYNPKNPRPITQTIAPSTRYTTGVKMTLTLPKNYVFE
jgi:LytS/YehU family sensor histidine kinase